MRMLIITALITFGATVCVAETFDLAVGEFYTLNAGSSDQFTIGFTAATEDSRCPTGVTCFWQGNAAIALSIQKEEAAAEAFTLHTAFENSTERHHYTIKLDTVSPYPENEVPNDLSNYIVRITATPNVALPVNTTTWGAIKTLYR